MSYDFLFEKQKFGSLELNNRIVMAPMTRRFANNGVLGPEVREYYAKRASCGLIITEGTVVNHKASNGYEEVPYFYGKDALEAWKEIVSVVHGKGGKIMPQLWHVGNARPYGMEPNADVGAYGPMEIKNDDGEITCTAMTQDDIDEVVAAFADAAQSAKEIGFDGVELHGAHGYLIDNFLHSQTNSRTDKYGGSIEKGVNLLRKLSQQCVKEWGMIFQLYFAYLNGN